VALVLLASAVVAPPVIGHTSEHDVAAASGLAGSRVRPDDPQQGPPPLPTPPLQPLVRDVLPGVTRGVDALDALDGDVFARVARQNGQSVDAFTRVLADDPTAFLDGDGRLLYRDPLPPGGYAADAAPTAAAPFPNSQTFLLHSRPGSNRVLYLDFDGYSLPAGTGWRGGQAYTALPYDLDGNGATWNQAEHDTIQSVWQRISEDYAPFDIDVTTQDPGSAAIDRTTAADDVYGGVVVFTNSPSVDFCAGCGGVSYVGTVDDVGASHNYYQPSWVFNDGRYGVAKYLVEAGSHEFGHAVGLNHDGQGGDAYYAGHGMWAPIMGVGYYQPVVQWSKGEYTNATNTENDFAVAGSNGVALVADDAGAGLSPTDNLVSGASRMIGATPTGDIDSWRFVAPCTGNVTFTANVAAVSPNLSLELQLYDYGGAFPQSDNTQPVRVDDDMASGMGGSITRAVTAGSTYTVRVVPLANGTASTGWSNYGNVGRYSIDVAGCTVPAGVSGTVTESGSGSPVSGAWVAVLRTSDFSIAGGAVANGSGDFSAEVPPGSYYLYVVDPSGAHTAGFHGAPATVTVTSGAMTDADPQMVSLRGSVAGTVTETGSGTPVGGAWVIGINAATGATQRGAVANGAGQYSVGGLRPGLYRPVFVDPTGAHGSRYFPNSVDFLGATSLAVTAGGSTAANVALPTQSTTPGAQTLSGTVREAGTNTPLAGVFVVALRASDFRNAGGAVTNASGQYSLNVAAGAYKLAFIDSTGLHNMEWHDNQPNTGLATATSVTAPAVTNAALDANTGSMAGTVTDDPSGTPITGAWVVAIGPTGNIAGGAVTAANGTYTIAGLAPGTYRATFVDPNGGRTQEYYDGSPDYAGSTPINITAANTTTINASLAYPSPSNNDAFINAQVITGVSGTVSGTNATATTEPGEPDHGGGTGGGSVWYRWTAPSAGTATFTTCGSDFDTVLAAYTGNAVNSLTPLASNDDSCGLQSSVSFSATAGVTYRIAVDGYYNARGAVTLNWSPP
jgi:hypothetical protein